jgi:uncharacterized protein (DUF1499 family)
MRLLVKLSFILPAVALALLLAFRGTGVTGIPLPKPMDITAIVRPDTPNTALAAPADFTPKPDITTNRYDLPASTLYAAVIATAQTQRRTFLLIRYDDLLQAHFVARSAVFGFPDLIAVQVLKDGADRSRLVLWSRSVYGVSDFGVNRQRLNAWLAALAPPAKPSP